MVNIWNSLPNVVLVSSLDKFKNRLDRFWGNQDSYDYTAELTGAEPEADLSFIQNKV